MITGRSVGKGVLRQCGGANGPVQREHGGLHTLYIVLCTKENKMLTSR